jgi:predicted ATP-grasp superfamily ATP-dependent carboligase
VDIIGKALSLLIVSTGNNASMFLVKSMKFEKIFAVQSNHRPTVSRNARTSGS